MNAIIVFVRKAVLGEVKTRLATQIGNGSALKVYLHLLKHTRSVIDQCKDAQIFVFHTEEGVDEMWENQNIELVQQIGVDLGDRMANAFDFAFKKSFEKVLLIGSDCLMLKIDHLERAFKALESNKDIVIGPAKDGGYYLIGMKKQLYPSIFKNIEWSTNSVFERTAKRCFEAGLKVKTLDTLSDVDFVEDLNGLLDWKAL